MKQLIVILILLIAIPSFAIKTPDPVSPTPYQTVYDYTMALKEKNFNKAYQYITSKFAKDLSEEDWVLMMRVAAETLGWKLLEFKILKVYTTADIALVIARGTKENKKE